MILSEFHALVSESLKRGTTLDARIPGQVKLAVQWLERNYTFKYMEVFRLLQIVSGARTLAMPTNATLKGFKFIRMIGADGYYETLNKVEPEDLAAVQAPSSSPIRPASYFVVGNSTIVFDSTPGEDLSGEAMYYQYTDWPTDDTARHPVLDMAADVLLHQTLMFMGAFLRDMEMIAAYKALRDEGLNTMLRAEDEVKHSGESVSMAFPPR